MLVDTQPSAQSSFQILNVDNSSQQIREISYYIFEVFSTFTVVLKFTSNILASIVWGKRFWQ